MALNSCHTQPTSGATQIQPPPMFAHAGMLAGMFVGIFAHATQIQLPPMFAHASMSPPSYNLLQSLCRQLPFCCHEVDKASPPFPAVIKACLPFCQGMPLPVPVSSVQGHDKLLQANTCAHAYTHTHKQEGVHSLVHVCVCACRSS